jgi:hypothetical protein
MPENVSRHRLLSPWDPAIRRPRSRRLQRHTHATWRRRWGQAMSHRGRRHRRVVLLTGPARHRCRRRRRALQDRGGNRQRATCQTDSRRKHRKAREQMNCQHAVQRRPRDQTKCHQRRRLRRVVLLRVPARRRAGVRVRVRGRGGNRQRSTCQRGGKAMALYRKRSLRRVVFLWVPARRRRASRMHPPAVQRRSGSRPPATCQID